MTEEIKSIPYMATGRMVAKAINFYKKNFTQILSILIIPIVIILLLDLFPFASETANRIIQFGRSFVLSVPIQISIILLITLREKNEDVSLINLIKIGIKYYPKAYILSFLLMIPLLPLYFGLLLSKTEMFLLCIMIIITIVFLWYLSLRLYTTIPELVINNSGIVAILQRTWRMTKNKVGTIFGVVFISGLLPALVINLPVRLIEFIINMNYSENPTAKIISNVLNDLSTLIVIPYSTFILLVVYLHLKMEMEEKNKLAIADALAM